jgi:uncharacterized protein (TIGR04255 family)
LGVFYSVLKDNYKYSNKQLGTQQVSANLISFNKEMTLSLGGISMFYNETIKFYINNNSIAFNCLGNYILWDNYFALIKDVLNKIISTKLIKVFKRVGVRYINEYTNVELSNSMNFNFTFGFPELISSSYSFSSEFQYKNSRVVLNLNNNVPIIIDQKLTPTSTIDVDIIQEEINVTDAHELFNVIDNSHTLEKEVFIRLLKKDFLESLNPKY